MKTLIALVLAAVTVLGLSACGDGSGHHADRPDDAGLAVVRLVSQSAGGGQVGREATPVTTEAAVRRYTAGLSAALAGRLRDAIRSVHPAGDLFAQVVAVGCDVPPGATARRGSGATVVVRADPVPSPRQECFAPVTTVALVDVRNTY